MEPKCSLPHLQVLATCSYPEPDQSTPCHPSHVLNTHLNSILPSMPRSCRWFSTSGLPIKTLYAPLLAPKRATCTAHLIMQFSPLPCYLVLVRPEHPPQHLILEQPQPIFLSQCERPSFTPIQNNWKNNSFSKSNNRFISEENTRIS